MKQLTRILISNGPLPSEQAAFQVLFWGQLLFNALKFRDDGMGFPDLWTLAPAVAAAVVGMLLPRHRTASLIAHGIHLAAFAATMPSPSNYRTFCALLSLAWLLSFGIPRSGLGRNQVDGTKFAAATRILSAGTFFFAGLIKINADFVDPAYSPVASTIKGNAILRLIQGLTGGPMPDAVFESLCVAFIHVTIIGELAVAFLLLSSRFFILGLVLDYFLHLLLGLRGYPASLNFPLLAVAVQFLWVPDFALKEACVRALAPLNFLAAGLWMALFLVGGLLTRFKVPALGHIMTWLWLVLAAGILVILVAGIVRNGFFHSDGRFKIQWINLPVLTIAVIVFLNGISPYIGFRTMGAYEMFSGFLRIGGRTNHLFIPAFTTPLDRTDRWVRVLRSSDPVLSAYAGADVVISWTHFKRLAQRAPYDSVEYRDQDGKKRRVGKIADNSKLRRRLSFVDRFLASSMVIRRPRLSRLGLAEVKETGRPAEPGDALFLIPARF